MLGTGFGLVVDYGNCDATYGGPMLGYWSDNSVSVSTPRSGGIGLRRRRLEEGHPRTSRTTSTAFPSCCSPAPGRIWEAFRPTQNVELDAFFERAR